MYKKCQENGLEHSFFHVSNECCTPGDLSIRNLLLDTELDGPALESKGAKPTICSPFAKTTRGEDLCNERIEDQGTQKDQRVNREQPRPPSAGNLAHALDVEQGRPPHPPPRSCSNFISFIIIDPPPQVSRCKAFEITHTSS